MAHGEVIVCSPEMRVFVVDDCSVGCGRSQVKDRQAPSRKKVEQS